MDTQYLRANVAECLTYSLAELALKRPADPISFLSKMMLQWKHDKETTTDATSASTYVAAPKVESEETQHSADALEEISPPPSLEKVDAKAMEIDVESGKIADVEQPHVALETTMTTVPFSDDDKNGNGLGSSDEVIPAGAAGEISSVTKDETPTLAILEVDDAVLPQNLVHKEEAMDDLAVRMAANQEGKEEQPLSNESQNAQMEEIGDEEIILDNTGSTHRVVEGSEGEEEERGENGEEKEVSGNAENVSKVEAVVAEGSLTLKLVDDPGEKMEGVDDPGEKMEDNIASLPEKDVEENVEAASSEKEADLLVKDVETIDERVSSEKEAILLEKDVEESVEAASSEDEAAAPEKNVEKTVEAASPREGEKIEKNIDSLPEKDVEEIVEAASSEKEEELTSSSVPEDENCEDAMVEIDRGEMKAEMVDPGESEVEMNVGEKPSMDNFEILPEKEAIVDAVVEESPSIASSETLVDAKIIVNENNNNNNTLLGANAVSAN